MSDNNLQIPYGVFNFKTIRTEGLYYVDKTGYIPLLENAGRFLFFVRPRRARRRTLPWPKAVPGTRADCLRIGYSSSSPVRIFRISRGVFPVCCRMKVVK